MLLVGAVFHTVLLHRLLKTSFPGHEVQCVFCVETSVGHLNQLQLENHAIKKNTTELSFLTLSAGGL